MRIIYANRAQPERRSDIVSGLANVFAGIQQGQRQFSNDQLKGRLANAQVNKLNSETDINRDRLDSQGVGELVQALSGINLQDGLTPDAAARQFRASDDRDFPTFLSSLNQSRAADSAIDSVNSGDFGVASGLSSIAAGKAIDAPFSQNSAGQTLNKFVGDTDSSSGLAQSNIKKNLGKAGAFSGIGNQANANADKIITGLGAAEEARKPLNSQDAKEIGAAREASDKAIQLQSKLKQVQALIGGENGFDTGPLAPLRAIGSNVGEALGITDGETAANAQQFDAIVKELGAETLALFGGSDTEKELEVALRTQPRANNQEAANNAIIDRKVKAAQILQQKPAFQEAWLTENGSLSARNSQGQTFSDLWIQEQKRLIGELGVSSDAGQNNEDQPLIAVNPSTGQRIQSTDGGNTWQEIGGN